VAVFYKVKRPLLRRSKSDQRFETRKGGQGESKPFWKTTEKEKRAFTSTAGGQSAF